MGIQPFTKICQISCPFTIFSANNLKSNLESESFILKKPENEFSFYSRNFFEPKELSALCDVSYITCKTFSSRFFYNSSEFDRIV